MSDINELATRIESTIQSVLDKLKSKQQQELHTAMDRQKLLVDYEAVQAKIVEMAKPRLEALAKRGGERIKVTPTVSQTRRAATFEIKSPKVLMTFSVSVAPDYTIQNAVMTSDLSVVPLLWRFDSHSECRTPVANPDYAGLMKWLDDRIIAFVELFMTIHESEIYNKAELVTDPVAKLEFPKFAAGATHDEGGKTLYFIDEQTKAQYLKSKG